MKIWFWLKNSRLFSLPMTILSWLVIFTYSFSGNKINGLLALIGIAFAHLATNLFDDYVDYKNLTDNCQQCKCAYIKEGKATINDVLIVVLIYLVIASLTGIILLFRCGMPVLFLALIGGFIALSYSKLSEKGLSEVAVGTAFGPLFFEGVYFVMKGEFSYPVFVMSIACVMFTIGLMYVHTVLDFEGDLKSGKRTLVTRFKNKNTAINGVFVVYGLGFLFTFILAILLNNYYLLFTFLLLPLVFDLHNSLKSFTCGDDVKEFYFRLLKARNLMVYNSLIMTAALIINFSLQ